MTGMMQNLKEKLPTSDDVLHAVGLQYERSAALTSITTLVAFAVGALAGAALATLFAPKPGRQVRQELNERMRAWSDRMGRSDRRAEDDEAAAH